MPHPLPRYYTDMSCSELTTTIAHIDVHKGMTVVILEDTIFHPQGGGQPADTGAITSGSGVIQVTHVKRDEEGTIQHIGTLLEGEIQKGDVVHCAINQPNRTLYTRLHSAGHLIDVALEALGIRWEPVKGYHFSDGPYVEYRTDETPHTELPKQLETTLAELIAKDILTTIDLQGPVRIIALAGKAIPCGGTHVQRLTELGSIHIRNIKRKSGTIKISYSVSS